MEIIDTTMDNIHQLGVCGYKSMKRPGFPEKIGWLEERFREGLIIKSLWSEETGTQGMIEYVPGNRSWRPICAEKYMVIHCLFVGFRKEYKKRGYASQMVEACMNDARSAGLSGVAVITRKGSFMVGRELFEKMGFESADKAAPDFELMAMRFEKGMALPRFTGGWDEKAAQYGDGLTVIRAFQCPYTVKNVNEIVAEATGTFGLNPKVVTLTTPEEVRNMPSPFGSFCIVYNGKRIAEHPISKGRFVNIMNKLAGNPK